MDLTRRRFLTHTACATAALGAVNPAALGAVLPTDPICSVRRGVTVLPAAADPAGRAVAWVVRDGAALVIDWASRAADHAVVRRALRAAGVVRPEALVSTRAPAVAAPGDRARARLAARDAGRGWLAQPARLAVGDEIVHVIDVGAARGPSDRIVWFEHANVVHLGGLVSDRLTGDAWDASGGSLHGWVAALETVYRRFDDDTLFVLGRPSADGASSTVIARGRGAVRAMRADLVALLDTAYAAMRADRTSAALAASMMDAAAWAGVRRRRSIDAVATLERVLTRAYAELRPASVPRV